MLAHVIPSLEIGGAQKLLTLLLPALKRQGKNVSLIVYNRLDNQLEKAVEEAGIPIISLGVSNLRSPEAIAALRTALKPFRHVHVHLFPALYHVGLASAGTRKNLYYTEHSTSNRRRGKRLLRPMEQVVYSRYKKIVAISEATNTALGKWLGPKLASKIVTIENGIDFTSVKNAEPSPQFPEKGYVLMVSRFVEQKDQETLVRAIPHVDNRELLFVFAGEGPTLDRVREVARKKMVEGRCVFLGNRDDVPELIAGSLMGVQSSKIEGFGLTAVEFMAAGKPVIGSDIPGLREVIGDESRLFPAGDEKMLAAKINAVLSDPRPNASDISRFNIDRMAADYARLYR